MIYFKSCPKCITGAAYEHTGLDGVEKKCINCAYVLDETAAGLISTTTERESIELVASA